MTDPKFPNLDDEHYSVAYNYEFVEDTRDEEGYGNYYSYIKLYMILMLS